MTRLPSVGGAVVPRGDEASRRQHRQVTELQWIQVVVMLNTNFISMKL